MAAIIVRNSETLEPVPFANVAEFSPSMQPTGRGFAANFEGVANFDGADYSGSILRVSAIGYEPVTIVMDAEPETLNLPVYLSPVVYSIGEAEIVTYKAPPAWWILIAIAAASANNLLRQ